MHGTRKVKTLVSYLSSSLTMRCSLAMTSAGDDDHDDDDDDDDDVDVDDVTFKF